MPINLTITRPKLDTSLPLELTFSPTTPITTGAKIQIPIVIDDLATTPSSFTCTYTSGSPNITFTLGTGLLLSNFVRVGDNITGDSTAFPSARVSSVSQTGTTVTVVADANAVESSPGGGEVLSFGLASVDSTVYILELEHQASGSSIVVKPAIYLFDGSKVRDINADGDDDLTVTDATSKVNLNNQAINIDSFLLNARLQRINS